MGLCRVHHPWGHETICRYCLWVRCSGAANMSGIDVHGVCCHGSKCSPAQSLDEELQFQNLSFQGPLGINLIRKMLLIMEGAGEYLCWNFSFCSALKNNVNVCLITLVMG